jgi:hypothetical protein
MLAWVEKLAYEAATIGEHPSVTQDPNSDVDRAVAAFGASPMPYRTFGDVPTAPAGPDKAAERVVDFPLLLAALPEVAQLRIPNALDAGTPKPDNSEKPYAASFEPVKTRGKAPGTEAPTLVPHKLEVQTSPRTAAPEQARRIRKRAVESSVNSPVQRDGAPSLTVLHRAAPRFTAAQIHRTPLDEVFRTLGAAAWPWQDKRAEIHTELQNMFRLL